MSSLLFKRHGLVDLVNSFYDQLFITEQPQQMFTINEHPPSPSENLFNYEQEDEEIEVESSSASEPQTDTESQFDFNVNTGTTPKDENISYPADRQASTSEPDHTIREEFNPSFRNTPIRKTVKLPTQLEIPLEYTETHNSLSKADVLNLDCVDNKRQTLKQWASSLAITILTNKQLHDDISTTHLFIAHKLAGNVEEWYSSRPDEYIRQLSNGCTNGNDYLKKLVRVLTNEFIGDNEFSEPAKVREQKEQEAIFHLQNMVLCDICLLDNFYCEYEKYFHRLSDDKKKHYMLMFMNLIPGEMGEDVREILRNNRDSSIPDTLAGYKRICDEYILRKCHERKTMKQMKTKVKICCKKTNPNLPGQYGCAPISKPKKKKARSTTRSKKSYYKRFKVRKYDGKFNYRKPFTRKRKFFRRKPENKRARDCPRGKATCKCWLCNEDGHYANACPQRHNQSGKYDRKIKMLEFAYTNSFIPIESDNDSDYEIYTISEQEDYTTSSSSSDYSDTDTDSD